MRPLRIALLTDEHLSLVPTAGGLAQYVNRMSRALRDLGHQVEIFTQADAGPLAEERDGMRFEAVTGLRTPALRLFGWLGRLNWRLQVPMTNQSLCLAAGMQRAVRRRHRLAPFDFVQSTNLSSSGIFIDLPGRPHLMRMSCARDLWFDTDGRFESDQWLDCEALCRLELIAIDRATEVFAPSQYLADYFWTVHGRRIEVLRPPAWVETEPARELPFDLPARFFLHFGSLQSRKGTDLLGEALVRAWSEEPELRLVLAGHELEPGLLDRLLDTWGAEAGKVTHLGALPRDQLYAVLLASDAAVLPSRVDNLPNTAIESLSLGRPVIGSRGASLDELIEDGRSGALVGIGDAGALAAALVTAWRRQVPWLGEGFVRPRILEEMRPESAARRLIQMAGF